MSEPICSKASSQAYKENWERIFGKPLPTPSPAFVNFGEMPIILDPTQAQDELKLVTSTGTVHRIYNIGRTEG